MICARSTELSDNTIKTLPILCQSVRQLQLQERINLYIMTSSSSLPLHIFFLSLAAPSRPFARGERALLCRLVGKMKTNLWLIGPV